MARRANRKRGRDMAYNSRQKSLQDALLRTLNYQFMEWDLTEEEIAKVLDDLRSSIKSVMHLKKKRPSDTDGSDTTPPFSD